MDLPKTSPSPLVTDPKVQLNFDDINLRFPLGVEFLKQVPCAKVTKVAADQAIPNSAATVVTFDTSEYDTDTMFDDATDSFIIKSPGRYDVKAGVSFATNALGVRDVEIRLNGSDIAVTQVDPAALNNTELCASADFTGAIGDVLQVVVFQNSGGALNVLKVSVGSPTNFSIHRFSA